MNLHRVVGWVQGIALAAAAAFVILLFAAGGNGGSSSPGAQVYSANCARCHGADGAGAVGPALANVVAQNFPDIDDQIALVKGGIATMPAFEGVLSEKEIRQVVEYTRTELGR